MSEPGLPAWAREEAFSKKPESAPFGVSDGKGKEHGFESLEELQGHLGSGKGRLAWVWVPERDWLIAPEEVPELAKVLKKRRLIFVAEDEEETRKTLPFTGILLCFAGYSAWTGGRPLGFEGFHFLVISLFAFLYFTARPWWEARKGRVGAAKLTRESLAEEIPEARFDLWMESQRNFMTMVLLGIIGLVWVVQFFTPGLGVAEAGLDKVKYARGEWWRLFTGALMHGNVIHFVLNASALLYLGRRVGILARWPHLLSVFVFSVVGAGLASVAWMPLSTSVGVSGVVCGLLGFLLVFETLHLGLVPRPARRRLLGILISLVVIGAVGFLFVDNAAHFGGLVTGAIYAAVVFPKSSSPHRPVILKRDMVLGVGSFVVICLSAMGAIAAMMQLS